MTVNPHVPLLSRCWRMATALVPERVRAHLRTPVRRVLKRLFGRPAVSPAELSLQLDAILRELRRLHARLEELQEGREGMAPADEPKAA